MMRALFAAIGGLRNHMTYMDVVATNIANINTTGYKASRVTFQDMLSQTITGASAPTAERGGTNPAQVGLGMNLRSIDVQHIQGALQATGKLTDFAVQGKGFFIVKDGNRAFYTRDGAFDIGVSGELVNPTTGYKVQGWSADAGGVVDTTTVLGPLTIPFGTSVAAQETTAVTFVGNLDAGKSIGETLATTIDIYDSLGASHAVTVTFTKNATANTWDVTVAGDGVMVTSASASPSAVVFDSQGAITTPTPLAPSTSSMQVASCVVSRSCTCGRRAKISSARAILESPTMRPSGR